MDILKIAMLGLLLSSCAKLNYIYEQSVGQISLFAKAKDNKEVIKNVRLPKENREKIKRIEELKSYFYKYWEKKETRIYSQTTILNSKAVTYLVVASPYEEIKAVESCFPLMGCFPYLGFFSLDSAKAFAKEKENDGYVTWVRPVYAYSTLGYFTDTILSSFFHYNDVEITELIFHELFHTIFFVKNEVELNENLANYFSKQMMEQYFSENNQLENLNMNKLDEVNERAIKKLIIGEATELQLLYKSLLPKSKDDAKVILDEFMKNKFKMDLANKCQELKIEADKCYPLKREWNNASFAAFLTYENKSDDLERLQSKLKLNLKEYYKYIVNKYNEYENVDEKDGFEKYLFKDLN
jgi:predicted aminopeptidase